MRFFLFYGLMIVMFLTIPGCEKKKSKVVLDKESKNTMENFRFIPANRFLGDPSREPVDPPEENFSTKIRVKTQSKRNGKEDTITLMDYSSPESVNPEADKFRS